MSIIIGAGDFGIGDLVADALTLRNQAEEARDAAIEASQTISEGKDLGPYNPVTNVPALTIDASAVVVGGYYTVTVAGPAPFAGTNFPSGQLLAVGDRIAKIGEYWYRRAFTISAGAEISVAGGTPNAIMNRTATEKIIPVPGVRLTGKNLFNRNNPRTTAGQFVAINTSGTFGLGAGYITSVPLAVLPGEQYTFSGIGINKAVRFEDNNHVAISGAVLPSNVTTTVTTPSGCAFMVFTIKGGPGEAAIPPFYQVEKSGTGTAYEAYSGLVETVDGNSIRATSLVDGAQLAVPGTGPTAIVNKQMLTQAVPVVNKTLSKNLFNPASPDIKDGQFIALDNSGAIGFGTGYRTSAPTPCMPGSQYTFSGVGINKAVRFEDSNHVAISGQVLPNGQTTTVTTPEACVFMVYTVKGGQSEASIPVAYQLEAGPTQTAYQPYSSIVEFIDGNPIRASLVASGARIETPGNDPKAVLNRETVQTMLPQKGLKIGRNLFNRNQTGLLENTAISIDSQGNYLPAANYQTVLPVAVLPGEQYTFSGVGANKAVRFENAAHVSLGGAVLPNGQTTTVTTPPNCAFIVYSVRSNGEASIPVAYQVERGSVGTAFEPYVSLIETLDGSKLAASTLAGGATMPTSGTDATSVPNRAAVREMLPQLGRRVSKNLFNRLSTQTTANQFVQINTSGNYGIGTGYITSAPTPCMPNMAYTFSKVGVNKAVRFEDVNHNALGGAVLPNVASTTVTTPANCAYMVYTIKGGPSEAVMPAFFQVEQNEVATGYQEFYEELQSVDGVPVQPYWSAVNGLKLLIFGDSLATVAPEGGGPANEWPLYIKKPYWNTIYHAATGGARIKDDPDTPTALTPRQRWSGQVAYAIQQGWVPDVIFISLGTNDFVVPNLGDYTTAMAKTTLASLDRTNVYEALRYNYWNITTQWPLAKVFHGTTVQRASSSLEVMAPVNTAIKRMAPNYCVQIIDAEAESGVIRQYETQGANGRYLRDGLHPNASGYVLLAEFYMRKIINGLL